MNDKPTMAAGGPNQSIQPPEAVDFAGVHSGVSGGWNLIARVARFLSKSNIRTMKTSPRVGLLAVPALASSLFAGCASVSLPPASSYSVQIGNTGYLAQSVKFHGQWIELGTEAGPVWAKNSAVTIKPNK